jgi:patatin-like phospholipase/acyl hydrolase
MTILPQRKVARILSIDGGGIRGLVPATYLKHWETELGAIANRFHMVAGTSTGGILSCALTSPART